MQNSQSGCDQSCAFLLKEANELSWYLEQSFASEGNIFVLGAGRRGMGNGITRWEGRHGFES